jgi:hypothetical protein
MSSIRKVPSSRDGKTKTTESSSMTDKFYFTSEEVTRLEKHYKLKSRIVEELQQEVTRKEDLISILEKELARETHKLQDLLNKMANQEFP